MHPVERAVKMAVATPTNFQPENGMHLKTILNRVYHHPGFVYSGFKVTEQATVRMWVTVKPRRGSQPICSGCDCKAPGYDTLAERYFEFIPLWGILVFFLYPMRRVDCPRCGVTVEKVPWANGKSTLTKAYAYFLAAWAKRMSWAEVARAFNTSWESVFRSVKMVVAWVSVPRIPKRPPSQEFCGTWVCRTDKLRSVNQTAVAYMARWGPAAPGSWMLPPSVPPTRASSGGAAGTRHRREPDGRAHPS